MKMIHNPILPGFYPDPSICRVEDDFYLVTSSFSYFPGIPVFHSRDLIHWEQIGHVLDRKEQVHLTYQDMSTGIFASTIRYHEGVFYVISTNLTTMENFICTADHPAGPWSMPHVIKAAGGIDPSLFFDDDGSCYFTGTSPMGAKEYDHQMIVLSKIDLDTFQLTGEVSAIGDGALKGAGSPEGPHIYKKDGWYYLLIAEGGTEHFHAVTVSRSKNITGPYENYAGNPILTHRHLGKMYPICNVGHADLVELADGSWYMVCLGSRLMDGYHKLLGRETFLAPVSWEDGWPVVSAGTGKIEEAYEAPDLPEYIFAEKEKTSFGGEQLGMEWNTLGTPYEDFYCVSKDRLYIQMKALNLVPWEYDHTEFDFFKHISSVGNTKKNMPFVGRRICAMQFEAGVTMRAQLEEKQGAGIVLLQHNANQLRLEVRKKEEKAEVTLFEVKYCLENGMRWFEEKNLGSVDVENNGEWKLRVKGDYTKFFFFVTDDAGKEYCVAENVDGSFLGSETCGGFVGTYIGLFASGNGTDYNKEAEFSDFFME